MKFKSLQFQISQMRQEQVIFMIQAVAIFVFSIFLSAFLPQLLFKYVYANKQLTAEPPIFSYIQVGTFILGVGYFLYAAVGNLMRAMKIKKMEKQLMEMSMMGGSCCGDCDGVCSCDDHSGCECGCEVDGGESMMSAKSMSMGSNDSAAMMMAKAGGKKKKAGKK